MSISFYDLSVGSFQQTVSGMQRVLQKGLEFAADNDIDPDTYVGLKLYDDMLPMLFQVACIPMHTTNALSAIERGVFTPPKDLDKTNYMGLQEIVTQTGEQLAALDKEAVESLSERNVLFKMGDLEIPFTASNFIMSFSLPNLNFHATTAYDLLRQQGVPLGKSDFLGKMRIGV